VSGSLPGERRGGRQAGTPNKRTAALARAQAESSEKVTQALGPAAFDGDALSFLQLIYRDATQAVETRLHAAKAAVAYEMPRLQSIAMDVKQPRNSSPFVVTINRDMSPQEAADHYARTLKDFEDIALRVVREV
jgi:hypothetical protein